jgi:hypothetical protein
VLAFLGGESRAVEREGSQQNAATLWTSSAASHVKPRAHQHQSPFHHHTLRSILIHSIQIAGAASASSRAPDDSRRCPPDSSALINLGEALPASANRLTGVTPAPLSGPGPVAEHSPHCTTSHPHLSHLRAHCLRPPHLRGPRTSLRRVTGATTSRLQARRRGRFPFCIYKATLRVPRKIAPTSPLPYTLLY